MDKVMYKSISKDWVKILNTELSSEYFKLLNDRVEQEYREFQIFPRKTHIFRAFNLLKPKDVKVVIVGQDPYHGENDGVCEANGLAFSVDNTVKVPPSLRNIFKELYNDLGIKREETDLSDWAGQGVLLLNRVLTVRKDAPKSHANLGWEEFTKNVLLQLLNINSDLIFVLWGNDAKLLKKELNLKRYPNVRIIESAHPSPLSAYRGFFGTKPFSQINEILNSKNTMTIKW